MVGENSLELCRFDMLSAEQSSIDRQTPGPITANDAASVADMIGIQGGGARKNDPNLNQTNQCSDRRGPQTKKNGKMSIDKPAPISSAQLPMRTLPERGSPHSR